MFANGWGDKASIPGWFIPKTQKMVLIICIEFNFKQWILFCFIHIFGMCPKLVPATYMMNLSITLAVGKYFLFFLYIYIYIYIYMLWCNRYHHGKWIWWSEFKILDEAVCISHSANTLGKGMNTIISLQQWVNCRAAFVLCSLTLVWQPV